jgi:hypothetical protein
MKDPKQVVQIDPPEATSLNSERKKVESVEVAKPDWKKKNGLGWKHASLNIFTPRGSQSIRQLK